MNKMIFLFVKLQQVRKHKVLRIHSTNVRLKQSSTSVSSLADEHKTEWFHGKTRHCQRPIAKEKAMHAHKKKECMRRR